MFGWFKGLFGEDTVGKATEAAAEMCILDDMAAEETAAQAYALEQAKAEQLEQSKRKLRENMQTISDISYSLEQAMGDQALGIREGHYLSAFYCGVFYDIACGGPTTAEQGKDLLTHLLSCCPETYFDTAAEVIEHAQANDSVGQLFHAMCQYPLIILEWASQTGRKTDGTRFLNAFEGGIYAASEVCELLYPGIGLDKWAKKVGYDWFGELLKPI